MELDWNSFVDRLSKWFIERGPSYLFAIVVLIIGLWAIRFLSKWIGKALAKKSFSPTVGYFLQNLIVITLQIMLLLAAFQIAGIQLSFLAAIIAGLSVAAGLALSGTLQNFVCGILILLLRPFRVNDNIIVTGQEGTVTSIQLFYTVLLTFDNKTIIVPNGQLSNNVVVNLSREGKRRFDIQLKFSYANSLEEIKKTILDSIGKTEGILNDPATRIGIVSLEPDKFSVSIELWAPAHGYRDMQYRVQEQLLQDLVNAGLLK